MNIDSLFRTVPLASRSLFQRLFKQHPEENVVIEVNNLLATTPILQISRLDIAAIERKYNLNLRKEFGLNLEEFYAVVLNKAAADLTISDDEWNLLRHLWEIFELDDRTVTELHLKIGQHIYPKALASFLSKGYLMPGEHTLLSAFVKTMNLPAAFVNKTDHRLKQPLIDRIVDGILRQEQYSPEDQRKLHDACSNLGIRLELKDKTKWQLERLQQYWALEHEPLKIVSANIMLQKGEACYYIVSAVNWYELRSVRHTATSVGYSSRIKLAKGLYLNTSRHTPRSYTTQEMKLIESGTLYLTNKRILLTSRSGNTKNIKLDKILNVHPYKDGIEIIKDMGKTPLLEIRKDADLFTLVLQRLIAEG